MGGGGASRRASYNLMPLRGGAPARRRRASPFLHHCVGRLDGLAAFVLAEVKPFNFLH